MNVSPAGILFVLLVFRIYLKKEKCFEYLFLLCLTTETFFRKGYIFAIGESYVKFDFFIECVLIFYCITHIRQVDVRLYRGWLLWISSLILPLILLILFPSNELVATHEVSWDEVLYEGASLVHPIVNGHVVLMTMKMCLFSLVYIYIYLHWEKDDYKIVVQEFSRIANVFLVVGVLEFVVKNVFRLNDLWGTMLLLLFGETPATVYEGRLRGFSFELTLFAQEASHYALTLLFICIVILTRNVIERRESLLSRDIWLAVILSLFSTSFSSIYLLIVFFSIYLIHRWYVVKPQTTKIEIIALCSSLFIIFGSFLTIVSMYSDGYIGSRVAAIVENWDLILSADWVAGSAIGDMSSQVRLVSIVQTLFVFCHRPIFGYSMMSIESHGVFADFLAGVGVWGLICWLYFYFSLIPLKNWIKPMNAPFSLCILLQLLTHLLGGDMREFYGAMLLIVSISFIIISAKKEEYETNIENDLGYANRT